MSRLSLQVFYLWRHVLSTAPPFILWWSNLEILFAPLHHHNSPFIGELRCQAIQTEHSPFTGYSRKNPKNSLYCEMSMGLVRQEEANNQIANHCIFFFGHLRLKIKKFILTCTRKIKDQCGISVYSTVYNDIL
jgi:hypothetical protein